MVVVLMALQSQPPPLLHYSPLAQPRAAELSRQVAPLTSTSEENNAAGGVLLVPAESP